ncbi:MAG: hypothetical protein ABR545_05325 [Cyclonatronaceae bacterium]
MEISGCKWKSHYANGVYFYEIRARESGRLIFNQVRKLIYVK